MNIIVLIAGVHDPKWPIKADAVLTTDEAGTPRILSPFDEAALEIALRIRDADPAVTIAAIVAGGASAMRVARAVAAFPLARVSTLSLERPWDQGAVARAIAPFCGPLFGDADLILMGREFGDWDDGLIPPTLAALLDRPFFARVQSVEAADGVTFMREVGAFAEHLPCPEKAVVSVTNDRRTRLRKPLMKNVMMARQAVIAELAAASPDDSALQFSALAPRSAGRNAGPCAMLDGLIEAQAHALADILWEARP